MEPFLGQIVLFAGNFAPKGWAFCHGQIMSISTYTALFSILSTTYGGNGQSTFALPNLAGRVAVGEGHGPGLTKRVIGEMEGEEFVTLNVNQLPAHNHRIVASNAAGTTDVANDNFLANGAVTIARGNTIPASLYGTSSATNLNINAVSPQGQNHPHENMQPFLVLNYIIALDGVFPSRN